MGRNHANGASLVIVGRPCRAFCQRASSLGAPSSAGLGSLVSVEEEALAGAPGRGPIGEAAGTWLLFALLLFLWLFSVLTGYCKNCCDDYDAVIVIVFSG